MTFKKYCKLMIHVLITAVIIAGLPLTLAAILYNCVNEPILISISLISAILTVYAGIKYMELVINKNWID